MKDHNEFNHDNLLDRAVEAVLHEPPPGEPSPERVADLVFHVRHAAEQPYPITLLQRIKNMKPMNRIAVTAAILIAFAGLMSWLAPHGGVSVAFAQVAEALNRVETATWKSETVVKGPDNKSAAWVTTEMFLAPSHQRSEITVNGNKTSVSIIDGEKDKMLTLDSATKTAVVIELKNLPQGNPLGRTFQGLRELVASAQSGKAGKVERLGEKVIDGRRADGFRIEMGAIEIKLWADPKSLLPIRVEEVVANPEVRIVMTDFHTGVNLDSSLFSVDVPAGYSVQRTAQLDLSKKPIQYLADSLKMAAGYNGGLFPAELRGEHGIDGIIQRGMTTAAKEAPAAAMKMKMKLAMDLATNLGGTFGLIFSLRPENDWHYAGKDVKLGAPDKPIFWYKPTKNSDYVVLYADLTVKEVSAKDAPKAPATDNSRKP